MTQILILFIVSTNFLKWSDQISEERRIDTVNTVLDTATENQQQISKEVQKNDIKITKETKAKLEKLDIQTRKKIEQMIKAYPDTIFAEEGEGGKGCACHEARIEMLIKEELIIEVEKNGEVNYKNFKIPVKTYIPLPEGGEKVVESEFDLEKIKSTYLKPQEANIIFKNIYAGVSEIDTLIKEKRESEDFQSALSNNNFTVSTSGEVSYNSIPPMTTSINQSCFGLSTEFFFPPRKQWFEMRWRWGVIPDPKWCQYIARSEFKIPVATITVSGDSRSQEGGGKGTFKTDIKGRGTQLNARIWNIYNEWFLRYTVAQIDRTVNAWLRSVSFALQALVPCAINGVELETKYDRDVWPSYPYFDTRIDPLWGSKRTSDFPDILSKPIPPALHDYWAHGPFAIVLPLLADGELIEKGTNLSQIDCARLSGQQIGGGLENLWNESRREVNPSNWISKVPGGGTFGRFVKFTLLQPLEKTLDYYCVGCWGYLFPRNKSVRLSSDYQAFALTAYRALSKMFDIKWPIKREYFPWTHITGWKDLQKMRADDHIYFQLSSPQETGCFQVGTSQIMWENRLGVPNPLDPSPDEVTFTVWRRVVLYHHAVWDIVT